MPPTYTRPHPSSQTQSSGDVDPALSVVLPGKWASQVWSQLLLPACVLKSPLGHSSQVVEEAPLVWPGGQGTQVVLSAPERLPASQTWQKDEPS